MDLDPDLDPRYRDAHQFDPSQQHHRFLPTEQPQQVQLPYQQQQQLHHHHQQSASYHHDDDSAAFRLQDPSTAAYAASRTDDRHLADVDGRHAVVSVDPDDFYKGYRQNHAVDSPSIVPMPTSNPRKPYRSNGDGNATRNHAIPATRPPGLRSASNPPDDRRTPSRTRGFGSSTTTVKDLTQRFDQKHTGAPSSTAMQRPSARPGAATRLQKDSGGANSHPGTSNYSHLRSGNTPSAAADGANGTPSSRSYRAKFVAEDQVSSNSQSFASRVGRPRGTTSETSNASEYQSYQSQKPKSPKLIRSPSPPSAAASQGLLFGEILPEQRDLLTVGYGIDDSPQIADFEPYEKRGRQRSFSDVDVEPSSPNQWYRNHDQQNSGVPDPGRNATLQHKRSNSDAAPTAQAQNSNRRLPTRIPGPTSLQPPHSSSKPPVSMRKVSSPTSSSSPASSRANSPPHSRRTPVHRKASGTSSAIPQAKTPVSRARTPTQATPGRKKPISRLASPNGASRLQTTTNSPLPKTSPPLRSSRPRQPVSMASTASSRLKMVDRTRSPSGFGYAADDKPAEAPARRRKISIGPIDFEQRREHIRLAYSRSIRESQALEARQRAADRRRKELEAAAKAKAAAAEAAASLESPSSTTSDSSLPTVQAVQSRKVSMAVDRPDIVSVVGVVVDEESVQTPPEQQSDPLEHDSIPLKLSTTASQEAPVPDDSLAEQINEPVESPNIGLPGSFPVMTPPIEADETPPQSAISATSAVTEFDVEPQTNPPVQAISPLGISISVEPSTPPRPKLPVAQAEYRYPFEDEPESPVQPEQSAPAPPHVQDIVFSSTITDVTDLPEVPGAFMGDYYEDESNITPLNHDQDATVTILPLPQETGNRTEVIPVHQLMNQDGADESECHSETDLDPTETLAGQDELDDTCSADETDDQDGAGGYNNQGQFNSQRLSQSVSTCVSTEADDVDEPQYSSCDDDTAADGESGLLAPPVNKARLSSQSTWTDLSVDSNSRSGGVPSPNLREDNSPQFGHVTIFTSPSSNRDSVSSSAYGRHRLPEVDMGDGFTIPYLSSQPGGSSTYVPSPDYIPPPIPASGSESAYDSRRTSAFYDQSQYDSTVLNSGRPSEDYMSQMGKTGSIDSASLSTPDPYSGAYTPADQETKAIQIDEAEGLDAKERERLVQRRNVIKELVDTEAVFVRDMNIVEEIYKGTAEACPELDATTVKLIFRNTDEIIDLHTSFLNQIKDAVAAVYIPSNGRSTREGSSPADSEQLTAPKLSEENDRSTSIGPVFQKNMEKMKAAHESFLRNSDQAAKKLIQIQQDPTVKVWLNECNEVAKDLTAAWDLDSLLIKPMQRITKYPNLIITLMQHTPQDHPDRADLQLAKDHLETAILEINKTKKNFELVGQIVGRKRKESDVRAGFARAFGKRVDKLQASNNRPVEDPVYAKLNEKFGDDYLRLQVVLRDVEFYTRQVSAYVHEFLQYLSSIELVMRLQPGNYPEIESKWVQFNISSRDLQKVVLEEHLSQVRKQVIEPFEHVIKAYGNPSLAMKKRHKRRLDYERYEQLRRSGRSVDTKLREQVEQYEALNDTLKKELPKLSALTEKIGNICLGNFVNIQANWYRIWKDKMKVVLGDGSDNIDLQEVVSTFQRDYPFALEQLASLSILNPAYRGRVSQSTTMSADDAHSRTRSRPSDIETRGRGLSTNGDIVPSLPTPDFAKRQSGTFAHVSPPIIGSGAPSPHHYHYKDYYSGIQATNSGSSGLSMHSPEVAGSSRSVTGTGATSTRPSTGRSLDSGGIPRQSSDSAAQNRRDSNTTYSSNYAAQDNRRFSGLFHSALPLPDGPEESAHRSSRASSRERTQTSDGYNILWLAASLFEFNIATTKHEAGYPYLVYQAGEIFDVIAEKGELWLAKNQDDPTDQVGWIWSKHFAKLADS